MLIFERYINSCLYFSANTHLCLYLSAMQMLRYYNIFLSLWVVNKEQLVVMSLSISDALLEWGSRNINLHQILLIEFFST